MAAFYLPSHEWARQDGGDIVIGLSSFAAGEVGDVIHVQLPTVGAEVARGKACAEIESVKSVNDFFAPVDGQVVAVNTALATHPELVNQDPSGKGWFARIKPSAASPLAGLLSEEQYGAQTAKKA
jgi:glycine cleavage system H protein